MAGQLLIHNALIVNENHRFRGSVLIGGDRIGAVYKDGEMPAGNYDILDARGMLLMPGVIDCHVHFREPGLTHKGDIASESLAAVAGGVTSFMEMPNTVPQTTTLALLEQKMELAAATSLANYSFFLGAANNNIGEITAADPRRICGVKVFFGASTGNMLVDNLQALTDIFSTSPVPVAAHCEDEALIRSRSEEARRTLGENVLVAMHPEIRSAEACFRSSELAVTLARKYNTRLHLTHLTTANELHLLDANIPLSQKRITAEVCPHYLYFSSADYSRFGTRMKVNPSIKTETDRQALLNALLNGTVDMVATDHAPHTEEEKDHTYFEAPSGTPMVQHSLQAMLQLAVTGKCTIEQVVDKMCHAPAVCYNIEKRGFIRPGYYADLVLVDMEKPQKVSSENILYKCGWSLFEGTTFDATVFATFVNGNKVYCDGQFNKSYKGQRLTFDR